MKTALDAKPYNTNAILSLSQPKPIGSPKSTKTGDLIFRERREWRPPRAHGFSETIPLGDVAPRRHARWRAFHQPQRPRPIKQRKRPAATLDFLNIDRLTLPLTFTLSSTQFLQNLRSACNLSCLSIVAP